MQTWNTTDSALTTASEVLKRLADFEWQGEEFYRGVFEGTKSPWVRKLARVLLKAEHRHRERFLAYAKQAEAEEDKDYNALNGPLPEKVARLLCADVFVPKARIQKSVQYAQDEEVLKLAIHMEEKLALLLTDLRPFVPRAQLSFINQVIREEWGHKAKLEKVMKEHFE